MAYGALHSGESAARRADVRWDDSSPDHVSTMDLQAAFQNWTREIGFGTLLRRDRVAFAQHLMAPTQEELAASQLRAQARQAQARRDRARQNDMDMVD